MFTKSLLYALAAAALASAQSNNVCSQTTITINSAADASALASCRTLTGNVVVGNQTDTTIEIDGPTAINGDLILMNNPRILEFSSPSIQTISGKFQLQNITSLQNLRFTALRDVKEIAWQSLPQLEQLGFGTTTAGGVSKVSKVVISDTYLNSLSGLNLATVDLMDINNNKRLTTWSAQLTNFTDSLNINANGQDLQIDFPKLTTAANLTANGVSAFTAPLLKSAGSLRFDSNKMKTFIAPNLTETGGDISFVDNAALTNISFALLKDIGGGLTIANNTALQRIDGFPLLETVGAVKLRGNFTFVELPALRNAKGAFDVQSTNDISSSCAVFAKLAPSAGGQIQGLYNCDSNQEKANEGDHTGGSGSGSGSGSGGDSSAPGLSSNFALLALAVIGGAVTSFL